MSINHSTTIQFIMIAVAAGTPLLFASVGELVAEQSGVMNLGVEGMMLIGGVTAYWADVTLHNLVLSFLIGAVAGCAMSAVHAFVSITLRSNQIVSGIALVIVGTGVSSFLGDTGSDPLTTRSPTETLTPLLHGFLPKLPIVGPLVFGQDVVVYASWLFVAGVAYYLFHTRWGMNARAVGDDPASSDSCGISVTRVRYLHVLVGGAAAGVAGAYMSVGLFGAWQDNLTNGTGWIAFAIVIFAGWRPVRVLIGAYLFGALTSLGFNLQLIHVHVALSILASLPYLLTLVALVISSSSKASRWLTGPRALGEPYWRESRT